MYDIAFLVFVVLVFFYVKKFAEWTAISALDFRIRTPEYFVRYPGVYVFVFFVLFASAVVVSFGSSVIPWYLELTLILIAWTLGSKMGYRRAYNIFREIYRELATAQENGELSDDFDGNYPDDWPAELRSPSLRDLSTMTDKKLFEMLEERQKFRKMLS